ncbi:MAG: hypothetical protein KDK70_15655 [Myxococcales bacterium]|nr:hypothetical protein [Myxococcales bacterium]
MAVAITLVRRVPTVRSWVRGEIDWHGHRTYEPPSPPAADRVDQARVHAELLPAWLIARSRRTRGLDGAGEPEAFEALREAVAPDANLTELLDELHALSSPGALAEDPRRALYLGWAWSRYLDQQQVPFVVHGAIRGSEFGPMLSAAIYRVDADAGVRLGEGTYRVRLVSRIDGTNLREQYLGAAGVDDAVLVLDRLQEFALADVWPLLDPWLELRPAGRRHFAGPLLQEAREHLSSTALRQLGQSAAARWQITSTLQRLEARQASCGSGFRINEVPWYGFDDERVARLRDVATRHADRHCPGITMGEVDALAQASAALDPSPELQRALEELVAWTAQHVAIHEARHLADAALVQGFDEPLPCASCADGMGIAARAELSGYLASLAWSPSPALALYQACRSLAGEQWRSSGDGQPHREALELLQRRIGPVCLDGPPPALRQLGRHLEVEMLGRSEVMALPADFPRRLSLE